MINSNQRYRAFTLLELTIAMLVAAVCLGIGFYVLSTFTRLGIQQQAAQQQAYMRQLFAQRMQKDALEARYLRFADNALLMKKEGQEIVYAMQDSTLLRIQQEGPTDTLAGRIDNLDIQFVDNLPEALVASLSFELRDRDGSHPFVLRKIYSAEELVHLQTDTPD